MSNLENRLPKILITSKPLTSNEDDEEEKQPRNLNSQEHESNNNQLTPQKEGGEIEENFEVI